MKSTRTVLLLLAAIVMVSGVLSGCHSGDLPKQDPDVHSKKNDGK